MTSRPSPFRDHDFIATSENFLFCVVGNIHPRGRAIGYLKYVPSKQGEWGRKTKYKRVLKSYTMPSVEETLELLRRRHPQYLFQSRVLGMEMSAVPSRLIRKHYKPEEALRELYFSKAVLDPLESTVVELTSMLAKAGRVNVDQLGITGSILTNIHNPSFSDIDLTVYGRISSLKLRTALEGLFQDGVATPFEGGFLENWAKEKAGRVPLSPQEIKLLYQRKRDRGFYHQIMFSIHPVKLEEEVVERYGDRWFHPSRLATIKAKCVDSRDSIFLPATYIVDHVAVLDGPSVSNIIEVTSYDGFYAGTIREGETLLARGKIEYVVYPRTGLVYHRLIVGSFEAKGNDFIKPVIN